MKPLQLLFCVATLLAFILLIISVRFFASSDKTDETKYFSHLKCAEWFIKCLMKLSENSNVVNATMQLNRIKRSFMGSGQCAQGTIWYVYKCFDCKKYAELTGNEC